MAIFALLYLHSFRQWTTLIEGKFSYFNACSFITIALLKKPYYNPQQQLSHIVPVVLYKAFYKRCKTIQSVTNSNVVDHTGCIRLKVKSNLAHIFSNHLILHWVSGGMKLLDQMLKRKQLYGAESYLGSHQSISYWRISQ